MIKNLKNNIRKNLEIIALAILVTITAVSTSYFNYKKNLNEKTYNNFIDNIYFKKTLNHIIENLEPKFKKTKHKIKSGETFDSILETYLISKKEITKIKNTLKKKTDLNKLNTKQIIQFTLDRTNNKIIDFTYQVSNTQKIFLERNLDDDNFNDEVLLIKLEKKILYKENIILQSLYKAASTSAYPACII